VPGEWIAATHRIAEAHVFEYTIKVPNDRQPFAPERNQKGVVVFARGTVPHSPEVDNTQTRQKPGSLPAPLVRLGSLPLHSGHDVRFVQERIALFAKVTFLVSVMFLVATVAGDRARTLSCAGIGRASDFSGSGSQSVREPRHHASPSPRLS
jgi:hypothetical protein